MERTPPVRLLDSRIAELLGRRGLSPRPPYGRQYREELRDPPSQPSQVGPLPGGSPSAAGGGLHAGRVAPASERGPGAIKAWPSAKLRSCRASCVGITHVMLLGVDKHRHLARGERCGSPRRSLAAATRRAISGSALATGPRQADPGQAKRHNGKRQSGKRRLPARAVARPEGLRGWPRRARAAAGPAVAVAGVLSRAARTSR